MTSNKSENLPTEQFAQVVEKLGSGTSTFPPPHLQSFADSTLQLPLTKRFPSRLPGPSDILIKISFRGVCHSDVHTLKADWPLPPSATPLVLGHEGAGIVVAKGALVTNFNLRDHVGVKWINGVCTKCELCRGLHEQLCPEARLSGYTVDGSFQQYAVVQAEAANRIPEECDLAAVAPVMCAGLTVYKGLKESGARVGEYIAIVGAAGGLGSFELQYAKAMGLIPIAIDGGVEKGQICRELGAASYIDFKTSKSVVDDLKKATPDGLGAHAAIIVSSEEEPFSHASEFVRPLGTVVILGIPTDGYIRSQVWDTIVRVITIKGSLVGNRIDTDEAVEFFRRGLIKVPYKIVGLSKLNETLERLDHSEVSGRIVVDNSA